MTHSAAPSLPSALGLASQREELSDVPLPVTGALPEWLSGSLLRVTPADLEPGGKPARHWFDGLAMLHSFAIEGGEVRYTNTFLRTKARERAQAGRPMRGFATDPCKGIFRRFTTQITDNANVNLAKLGERWAALSEIRVAVAFDPSSLETSGTIPWAPARSVGLAHPHEDPVRKTAITSAVRFGMRSTYELYSVTGHSRALRPIASVPVARPAYMHSFALTERHAVLFDTPLTVNPLQIALGKKSFIESYEWRPHEGARFIVVDLADGSVAAHVETEAFFAFHAVNAFEDGGEIVVDLCAYDDPGIIDALFLDTMRAGGPIPQAEIRRYRLPLAGGPARRESVADSAFELPRINYRAVNGKPYRYTYGVGSTSGTLLDRIVKADVATGEVATWREEGSFPGEPVFVGRPGATDEDDGVLLAVSLNSRTGRSECVVLDARDLRELARAHAPHHVPFGFHGQFDRR